MKDEATKDIQKTSYVLSILKYFQFTFCLFCVQGILTPKKIHEGFNKTIISFFELLQSEVKRNYTYIIFLLWEKGQIG